MIIRGIISSKNNQVQKNPPPTPRFIPSGEEPHSGFVQNRVKSVKKHKKTVAAGKAFVIQAEVHRDVFFGVKKDVWSAIAVGVTWREKMEEEKREKENGEK